MKKVYGSAAEALDGVLHDGSDCPKGAGAIAALA